MGGSNTYALEIVKNIVALGNEVTMVVPRSSSSNSIESLKDVQIIEIPILRYPTLSAPTFWLLSRMLASRIFKSSPFDIIHYNDLSGLLHKPCNIPAVTTIHHSARALQHYLPPEVLLWAKEFGVQQGFIPILEKHALFKADRIIAVSGLTKSTLVGFFGMDSGIIDVVHNGVSGDFVQERKVVQETKVHSQNNFVLLCVGRPERRKGVQVLLKALKDAIQVNPGIRLNIVGPGNWSRLHAYVIESGLGSHVSFKGAVTRSELIQLYQLCDAVVLPSYLEGFGLSILEGMASGKPVIATKFSGVREIVMDAKGGFIVDPTKPETLVSAIIELAGDKSIAKIMGQRNKSVAEALTWENSARRTLEVYETCLS